MCTMVLFYKVSETYPLIVASNRDERYGRPSSPPGILADRPHIIGGRDLKAGGTWMGVNEFGLWVGIANRAAPELPDPSRRSRGLLCIDLLRKRSSHHILSELPELALDDYNPLILAAVDRDSGFAATNGPDGDPKVLEPGFHVLSNAGFNREGDPRRERVLKELLPKAGNVGTPQSAILVGLLKDHGQDESDALCIHGPQGGTRSSTILALHQNPGDSRYFFADGPPCVTPYGDYSSLFTGDMGKVR